MKKTLVMIALAWLAIWMPFASGAENNAGAVPVLNLPSGSFQVYMRWKTPTLVDAQGKLKPMPEPPQKGKENEERPPLKVVAADLPPENWRTADFDTSLWPRTRGETLVGESHINGGIATPTGGPMYYPGNPTAWSLLCLRGTFDVADPAAVRDLAVNLKFHGGAVVYINGKELVRAYLPQGPLDAESFATPYALETYVNENGERYNTGSAKKYPERTASRVRTLAPDGSAVSIPANLLKKGINIVAIELHAAPVNEVVLTAKVADISWHGQPVVWPHVAALEASVTAAAAEGLTPSVAPAAGIAAWNMQVIESVMAGDYPMPGATIRPIKIVGARNGSFSGKVVLSSPGAIRDLKAGITDLVSADGKSKLAAGNVLLRLADMALPENSFASRERVDRLIDKFPAEIPAVSWSSKERGKVEGAVAPVWVTVPVPADAAPGAYSGKLSLSATGDGGPVQFEVPVVIKVNDWQIPAPRDFEVFNSMYQSPDTIAKYYGVEMWSDAHLKLLEKSIETLHVSGSRVCVLNLVAKAANMNNEESMVLWVKKPGGGYDYDFTAVDKYMDIYEKVGGKPALLQINNWTHSEKTSKTGEPPAFYVTTYDPATKEKAPLKQPEFGTPENAEFWRPVIAQLLERLDKRGWTDVAAFGHMSYSRGPQKEMVDVGKSIWPEGRWVNSSHSNPTHYAATEGKVPVNYSEQVWGAGHLYNPDNPISKRDYPTPWKMGERIVLGNPRFGISLLQAIRANSALALYHYINEAAIMVGVRGVGRVGGDFWPLLTNKGRYATMTDSFGGVGITLNVSAMNGPGPDGPVFTERLEMLREGAQLAEAITSLTKALDAGKLSDDLRTRVVEALNERARYYLYTRFPQVTFRPNAVLTMEWTNWQSRDDLLFSLAGEVAKATR